MTEMLYALSRLHMRTHPERTMPVTSCSSYWGFLQPPDTLKPSVLIVLRSPGPDLPAARAGHCRPGPELQLLHHHAARAGTLHPKP